MKVFKLIGALVLGVSHNTLGQELLGGSLHTLQCLVYHEKHEYSMFPILCSNMY